jgi:hypothetical protein
VIEGSAFLAFVEFGVDAVNGQLPIALQRYVTVLYGLGDAVFEFEFTMTLLLYG